MIAKKENCTNILEQTRDFFGAHTPLVNENVFSGRQYEKRSQQIVMAENIADAFTKKKHLCIEAPTGIGKSFAYLVPAIFAAQYSSAPIIISTETINLQEQLVTKDIPILKELTGSDFSFSLAKGRSNYLCKRRLKMVFGEHQKEFVPSNSLIPELEEITIWSKTTVMGSLSELGSEISIQAWNCVSCEPGNCLGPKCKSIHTCFYWKARKQWEKSDIVVANHALFFSDQKIKMECSQDDFSDGGILPQYGALIIDEAHQTEQSASKHMGTRISKYGITSFLYKLFNPDRGRGLLMRPGFETSNLRIIVSTLINEVNAFFSQAYNKVSQSNEKTKRIYSPGFIEDTLTGSLSLLERELTSFIKLQVDANYKVELEVAAKKCMSYTKAVFEFLNMNAIEESVYWIEKNEKFQNKNVTFNYSPLNIAQILNATIFSSNFPIILTSATLSISNNMNYFMNRIGFNGDEIILDSPFNYEEQVTIHIPENIPPPGANGHIEELSTKVKEYITRTHGKAFVLFTSYHSLIQTSKLTRPFLEDQGIRLLAQGDGMNRSLMLEEFKKDINSVIYGTTSFWMGVDVPGESLSNVIITRLPFAVPNDPIIEARVNQLEESGNNGFMNYSLPEAILRFKQGIGRLIRTQNDKGIIAILDNRIITKRYGKLFLKSLPPCPIIIE